MLDFGFYNMDCMEGMKQFPDKFFDLAIVDPPYGIGENPKRALSRARPTSKWKNPTPVVYSGCDWDNERPKKEYFEELFRVSRNQIIWGANYFVEHLTPSMGWIAWYKKGQTPNCDFSDCEFAYTSFNRASKFFNFPWVGFGAVNAKEKRIHPTQKPIALYEWLLEQFANPDDIILDTHVGSASSLIACHKTKHRYVGFELDKTYYDIARQRIAEETAQMTIYDFL